MDAEILNYFINDGVWAVLSGALIIYILRKQEQRDNRQDERDMKYQRIVLNLSEALKGLNEIKEILEKKEKAK